jgi:cyclase
MLMRPRVIPVLLLRNRGLVKTVRFKDPTYLGDPINVVKIFNDKEVDELVFLDINATIEGRRPPFDTLAEIASECFMPLGYGGGVSALEDIKTILGVGIEKVSINSHAVENPSFVRQAADQVGSQSVVVSIDVKKTLLGRYQVVTQGGRRTTSLDPVRFAVQMAEMGAGEILLTSVDRDGTMQGYDLDLIRKVAHAVDIPVVACGGAAKLDDLAAAVRDGGASAAAAGSMFVFQGKHRAVLISYPSKQALCAVFAPTAPTAPTRQD